MNPELAAALAACAQAKAERAQAEAERDQAVAGAQATTRFLAAASHDLRQPLQALTLFTQALRDKNRDDDLRALIDTLGAAVGTLDALFTEVLDFSRLDAGAVVSRPRDFALDEVYTRLRLHFEPLAFDKGLALRLRGGARRAHADPLLVERILRNLCANAIRHTSDGGVLVGARARGDRLLLQVWDSGVGIAPGDQSRIFDEFVQLDGAVAQAGSGPSGTASTGRPLSRQGHGLGLAIVRRLAALMQAPLALRSVPGRGSVFSLRLPRASTGVTHDG